MITGGHIFFACNTFFSLSFFYISLQDNSVFPYKDKCLSLNNFMVDTTFFVVKSVNFLPCGM